MTMHNTHQIIEGTALNIMTSCSMIADAFDTLDRTKKTPHISRNIARESETVITRSLALLENLRDETIS